MTRGPVYEKNYRVHWLTTVVSTAAPTVAEIGAGVYMGRLLAKDGIELGVSQNRVDIPVIDELFDSERMGSWGVRPSLTIYRDDTSETEGFDLAVSGATGFLVISPFQATPGTEAIGDPAYVMPAEMGVVMPADSGANSPQTFKLDFAVTSEPNLKAVIA